jgi:hypothetical protein
MEESSMLLKKEAKCLHLSHRQQRFEAWELKHKYDAL